MGTMSLMLTMENLGLDVHSGIQIRYATAGLKGMTSRKLNDKCCCIIRYAIKLLLLQRVH